MATTSCCDVQFKNPTKVKKLSEGNLEFALNLYQMCRVCDTRSNLTISPICITAALAMIWVGARNETAKQIWDALELGLVGEDDDEVHQAFSEILQQLNSGSNGKSSATKTEANPTSSLHMANRIYVDESYTILEEFSTVLSQKYLTEVGKLDFAAGDMDKCRRDINKWVEGMTNNNVRNLLQANSLGPSTRIVLVNAIHFKGMWLSQFHADKFHVGNFYRKKFENAIHVTMMENRGAYPFVVDYDFKCKVLEMVYTGSHLHMLLFLPFDVDGLPVLENKLTPELVKFLKKSMSKTKLTVCLPQICYAQGIPISSALMRLGIEDLFYAGRSDLSGITGSRGLHFFEFNHNISMDATDGNRVATPTFSSSTTSVTRSRAHEMAFVADHPFLFLVYDKLSKMVLFIGRYTDPTKLENFPSEADMEAAAASANSVDIEVKIDKY